MRNRRENAAALNHYHSGVVFIVILSTVIFLMLLTTATAGERDYSVGAWSEDIRLTNTTDAQSRYKNMLGVTELSDGRFNYIFEMMKETEYEVEKLSSLESDKLGGSLIQYPIYDLPDRKYEHGIGNPYREWVYHYDETHGTFNFVLEESFLHLDFLMIDRNGKTVLHKRLHIRDMGLNSDLNQTDMWWRLDACQDRFGRTNVIMTTRTDLNSSSYRIYSISFIYLLVTWDPFSVKVETIWNSPYLDTSNWNVIYVDTIPWPYICVGDSLKVAVIHPIYVGGKFYRALSIRDIAGTWTTHEICPSTDPGLGLFVPFSGIFMDNQSRIHATWVDRRQNSLIYACLNDTGSILVEPWSITVLPFNELIVEMRTCIRITDDGHVLLAFNTVPVDSRAILVMDPLILRSDIRLIVIRDASGFQKDYSMHKLVDIPTATECQLHIDDGGNIYLFWFDQRTGWTQLYMKYLARPGISLEINMADWVGARTIRPNETKVLPLRLRNVGSVEVDASVFVESNASWVWDLRLDRYRAHLESAEAVPVNLTVFCPPGSRHGDFIEIWVNASTSDRAYTSQIRLLMYVQWRRALEVTCRPTFHLVEAGGKATYRVVLQNAGEMDETVKVEMRGVGPPGWALDPGNTSLEMGIGEVRPIDVIVTAPAGAHADEAHIAQLDLLWGDGIQAAPRLLLRTVVQPTFFVTMEVNRTGAVVRPGEVAAFCVTVGNVGNLPGTAFIEVTVVTEPGEWLVLLSRDTVTLGPGQDEELELLMVTPARALGGTMLVVRLRAYCPEPFSYVTVDVKAEVEHLLSLSWDEEVLVCDASPLSKAMSSLNLTNGGNLHETVAFRLDGLGTGWTWWLVVDGVGSPTARVGPGETACIEVWRSVPADAAAGRHMMYLYLDAGDTTVGRVLLEVYVRQVRELQLQASAVRGVTYPGGHIEVAVDIRNQGNGPEVVALCATAAGVSDAMFTMDGVNVTYVWIPSGGTRRLVVWARVGGDAAVGPTKLELMASSTAEANVTERASVGFEVVLPSLRVARIELDPSGPRKGDIVAVTVVLYNAGPIGVVDVRSTMEGVGTEQVASIPEEGEATTVFVWVATSQGKTAIRGEVTFGPGNNTLPWSRAVDVVGEGSEGLTWVGTGVAVAGIVACVILLAVFWYNHMRRPVPIVETPENAP